MPHINTRTAVIAPQAEPSPAQMDTIRLLADTGMNFVLMAQDRCSMALIGETHETHKFHDGWDMALSAPIFTVITASGMTFCPYN